jgi:hypothetical protein
MIFSRPSVFAARFDTEHARLLAKVVPDLKVRKPICTEGEYNREPLAFGACGELTQIAELGPHFACDHRAAASALAPA